ncbi:MAG: carboxymuconolactone decarboxylase family protein [Pyrinomonadaceae bacterium]|nr:carboxymuconolactone decarboxylase family protein [Pyrinomonadaceae bacterium]
MTQRIDLEKSAPDVFKRMLGFEALLKRGRIDSKLQELVKIRVSQINGCAYCLDMHTKDARQAGETEQRLYCLSAWRESSFYSERERAALLWAERLTRISEYEISDELFDRVRTHFDEEELVYLTMMINMTNSWNRFAMSFQNDVGSYQPSGE